MKEPLLILLITVGPVMGMLILWVVYQLIYNHYKLT